MSGNCRMKKILCHFFNSPTVTYLFLLFLYFPVLLFFGLPTGKGRDLRPSSFSSLLKKLSPPKGLPVCVFNLSLYNIRTRQTIRTFLSPLFGRYHTKPMRQIQHS